MINSIFDFPVFPTPKTKYLSQFDLLTREIGRCLDGHYNDTSIGFSLNPEPGVEVGAKYFNQKAQSIGKSYICIGDGLSALRLFLSTSSAQSFILSYGDLTTQKNYLALRGKTGQFIAESRTDAYDIELAGGFKHKNVALETSYNPMKGTMGGWMVYRDEKIQLGCRLHAEDDIFKAVAFHGADSFESIRKVDVVGVYSSEVFSSLNGSEMPNQYNISVSALDLLSAGGKPRLVGGYLHKVLYYGRAVTLAGEFVHALDHDKDPEHTDVLRVGGAWQLSNRTAIKLRADSNGEVDMLFGIGTNRTVPVVSVAIGVGFNIRSKLNADDVRVSLSIHLGG
ncbi:hypothetical protein K493DRAFT_312596 [Basidiobolus meristosporus CBS 931.73]|uniref:Uncharacterized protein n=1 Tax=Basidiobolus meristosporus CBS 931.73 TaxID=1314790 RepID=A0A1Y1YTD3_9FUNG|nr:hypothetical protein K493DRAFT_312596 [Basidiobolus meristosporus CBS 931.73]|eukprot:ORY00997.1 hypothetical protein K493DRAFT_312596 [Basidiobolus meristosporus CBS 931.73]